MLKVFNPWNTEIWKNNPWADRSKKWTNEIKKQVGYKGKKDGIFYLETHDYRKYFEFTFFSKIQPNYDNEYVVSSLRFGKGHYFYRFKLKVTNNKSFYVFIQNKCNYSKDCINYLLFEISSFSIITPGGKTIHQNQLGGDIR